LLDGLLDISKLDAGIVESVSKQFQIQGLVAQHYLEVESVIRAKGLVPVLLSELNVIVNTDPQLLLRILRNLTDNAIKFTEHGQIQLSVTADTDFVCVCVADTGRGISAQHYDKIFQEFYQIENSERDRAMGLGLGLSIVKRLTDLLGIALTFTSTLHSGTQFTLRLPIVCNPVQLSQPAPAPALAAERFALTILIVDDEKAVRTSMRILLEELGCRCLEAGGTAEAVMLIQKNQPDFILADFRLRGEDSGIAAITAIKNRWPDTPALLVSGDTAPDRQREAYLAGIRLLHKPLSLEQLKQALNDVQLNRKPDVNKIEELGNG
jgi:CheY-like chemotaxis protein